MANGKFWQNLIYLTNTIKVLGNAAPKIRSVTKVFLGLSDVMFTEIVPSNILKFFHEIENTQEDDKFLHK